MLSPTDHQFLKEHFTFYPHLSKVQESFLLQNLVKKTYHKGEVIYNGTKECLGVLLLLGGELRSHLLSEEGKEVTLYRLFPGDICILSASCLLNNITFDVHITAEKNTDVLLIPSPVYQTLMEENIYVENFSYKTTIEKFSDVMWSMEQILFMSFDERLAVFLLDEASKTKSTMLSLTHAAIATYIGSAREVVSRMLKYFESEGMVRLSRGGIELLDMERLRALVHRS